MFWRVVLNILAVSTLAVAFAAWVYPGFALIPVPCEKPITYTLSSFDNRFGISQKGFLSALLAAEAIWEKPLGKELFLYTPEGAKLSVNLIYDYRQETTSTLSGIESTVEQEEASYDTLEARYSSLKAEYTSAKSVYDAEVEAFDEKNSAYEDEVEAWNNSKRTSKSAFEQLERNRLALEADMRELKVLEAELNSMVREINTLVARLNHLASSLNLNVKTYNTIGASRGETFTGGLYSQVEGEQSIDVYEFSSREKLVRVLTHELGHALGLEHVDDPKAIMYYLNEGETGALTETDLSALRALCYNEDITSPEQSRGEN